MGGKRGGNSPGGGMLVEHGDMGREVGGLEDDPPGESHTLISGDSLSW